MLFHIYGDESKPPVVLIPDSCCHWELLFGEVAELLSKDFRVAVAAYDGFDPERPEANYESLSIEGFCVASFINQQFGGKVRAVYGCGFGGRAAVVVAQHDIQIEHVIIDGCDFATQGKFVAGTAARGASHGFEKLFKSGELTDDMKKMLDGASDEGKVYLQRLFDSYGAGSDAMSFVKRKNIHKLMLDSATYSVGREVDLGNAQVHIWCPELSGPEFADDARRFPGADVRLHNAARLELLLCRPLEWVEEFKACCQG